MARTAQTKLQAGNLRQTVSIQRATESQDDYGQAIQTWATITTRRAEVRPMVGVEQEVAQQIDATVTHKVTIRYYDGLKPTDRFLFQGRPLYIVSVLDIMSLKKQMECSCREDTSGSD